MHLLYQNKPKTSTRAKALQTEVRGCTRREWLCSLRSPRGAVSQFRQVTPRRLFPTPLRHLSRARDETLSCSSAFGPTPVHLTHNWNSNCFRWCRVLLKTQPMVTSWESSFIAQVRVTPSYRHPAGKIGPNDWLLAITMRTACAIS